MIGFRSAVWSKVLGFTVAGVVVVALATLAFADQPKKSKPAGGAGTVKKSVPEWRSEMREYAETRRRSSATGPHTAARPITIITLLWRRSIDKP